MSLLEDVKDFNGIRELDSKELVKVCAELRKLILDVTLKNGGHLASSLGAVEIIVALLKAFNPEEDKIIFDVGHQAYAYKILTGRLERFYTLRQKGGIAGFPRLDESKYDAFTVGHSSTSISAAMGYAKARDLRGEKHNVISVIGDGALLNGVAFEALNNVEPNASKVIIVLNDNKMSINPRVGGMANHLARLSVNETYKKFKAFIKRQSAASEFRPTLENLKNKLKSILLPANVFEQFGISYWGPFDGHNVEELSNVFELAKLYDKSLVIHVVTKKGKGYSEVEANPAYFHGVSANSTLEIQKQGSGLNWSQAVADNLAELAQKDDKICALTAAMQDGTKLSEFAKKYPSRFVDTGIAEEHTLVYAAGLSAGGMKPAVCIYSTFLQRGADQIVHDICIPKLPVLLCIDRAGLVGQDGETHHGLLDIAWLKALPNMTIVAPRDVCELKIFMQGWAQKGIPMAIRYPRGKAKAFDLSLPQADWGKLQLLRKGDDVLLIGLGDTVSLMLEASCALETCGVNATVIDLRFIKPLDETALISLLSSHKLAITAEDGNISGGIGEQIAAITSANSIACKVITLGVPDRFISHATVAEQWQECGLTVENIVKVARDA